MLQAHLFDRRADVLVGDLRIDLLGGKDEALSDVARGKWLNRSGNQGWVRIEVRDQHTVVRQCRRKEYAMLCLDEACHSGHRGQGGTMVTSRCVKTTRDNAITSRIAS